MKLKGQVQPLPESSRGSLCLPSGKPAWEFKGCKHCSRKGNSLELCVHYTQRIQWGTVGSDASSGYGGRTEPSCLPTSVAGPAALWYHQALAIEMSSSESHRTAPGPSCGHNSGAAALQSQCCRPKCSTVKISN